MSIPSHIVLRLATPRVTPNGEASVASVAVTVAPLSSGRNTRALVLTAAAMGSARASTPHARLEPDPGRCA